MERRGFFKGKKGQCKASGGDNPSEAHVAFAFERADRHVVTEESEHESESPDAADSRYGRRVKVWCDTHDTDVFAVHGPEYNVVHASSKDEVRKNTRVCE